MIVVGNALALPLVDSSVQCVCTSPPYWGLRDYGVPGQLGLEPTPDAYVAHMVEVFREVRRVLQDDGVCWLNLGDSYSSGGRTTQVAPTLRTHGHDEASGKHAYLNTFAVRPGVVAGLKEKDLVGIPWRVAFALQADGWYLRSDVIWSKPNPMPEPVQDRPTRAHEYVFLLTKRARYYYNAAAIAEPAETAAVQNGRRPSGNGVPGKVMVRGETRNARSVWAIPTQPFPGAHFATMPEALAERCILTGSREGDVVLDPFAGSGTVIAVADRWHRRGVGVELSPTYADLARRRVAGLAVVEPVDDAQPRLWETA